MKAPIALRVLLILLLCGALVAPVRGPKDQVEAVVAAEGGEDALLPYLVASDPPELLARRAVEPPSSRELALLTALAERAPLLAVLPEAAPEIRIEPIDNLRAGFRTALPFSVRGSTADVVPVHLRQAGTEVDSLRLTIGPNGEARGAFQLRPTRSGWWDWTVDAGGSVARSGGWAQEVDAPRILVRTGSPNWESRFAVRALEESGATVSVSQALGPGVGLGEEFPPALASLAAYDGVVLVGDERLSPEQLRLLERYVAESGGAVVIVGGSNALPVLGLGSGTTPGTVRGTDVRWSLPAEFERLPSYPLEAQTLGLAGARPGVMTFARDADDNALVAVRALGFGRVAYLGLTETWRWRLEAGSVEEHREFWRALVDWAAGGARLSASARLERSHGAVGIPTQVTVYGEVGEGPPHLELTRPDTTSETLPVRPDPEAPGRWHAAFLPVTPGVHTLKAGAEEGSMVGFHALPVDSATGVGSVRSDSEGREWAHLAFLAHRSGGAMVKVEDMDAHVDQVLAQTESNARGGPSPGLVLLLLAALTGLTEWTIRRLRGLP